MMRAAEKLHDEGLIERKQLAEWRRCFAPSMLTTSDYVYLPSEVQKMWEPFFEKVKEMKK